MAKSFASPAELKAFRQANMAKVRAIRAEKLKKRNEPACHPERPMFEKSGLCRECYLGGEAAKNLSFEEALKLAKKYSDPTTRAIIKEQALATLIQHLPDYARCHVEAAKIAAAKGDARPAEWALTTIKAAGDTAVLEPPAKVAPAGDGGVKILIGVPLGGAPITVSTSSNRQELPAPVEAEILANG
jgi:hypothetical protein